VLAHIILYHRSTPLVTELFTLGLRPGDVPLKLNPGSVSQQPMVSADGARIAFYVSMVGPNGEIVEDIFAVDRYGTNMKRLTTTPGVDNAPAWSPAPGANVIAYQRLDITSGRSDIWLMNSDGTNARNLTADLPAELTRADPAWSPDGQWIAFASSRSTAGPGRGSIWIMRGDGTQKRQLTVHPGNRFDLSLVARRPARRVRVAAVGAGRWHLAAVCGPPGRHEHASPYDQSPLGRRCVTHVNRTLGFEATNRSRREP
jgi:Tol biopolymer transport system component